MAKPDTRSSDGSTAGRSRSPARSAATSAGSSRPDAPAGTSDDGSTIVSWDAPRTGKTDWTAVDALTDEEITEAVRADPDAVPVDVDWSQAVLVVPPKKTAISIRLDDDVLAFFKAEGPGYQRRINAVLRSYMAQARKKRTANGE
nr:BrnA antitoxin family protein [Rhodoplanes tepidamans]